MLQRSNNMHSQNLKITQGYQPESMRNEIQLPYYLQPREITKNSTTQKSNTAELLK